MRLSKLLAGIEAQIEGSDPEIAEVRTDAHAVEPGDLFVAVRGETSDGHAFVELAAKRGAHAIVVEWPMQFPGARVLVASAEEALARIKTNQRT